MIVAGGVYREICHSPESQALMGSGGRAAFALASRSQVNLETFHPADLADDVIVNFTPLGIAIQVHPSDEVIEFEYQYPLSSPRISPIPLPRSAPVSVEGPSVLRFGCLEGTFIVDAEKAVFDPQSGNAPEWFGANGSKAARLAIVCNSAEARKLSGQNDLKRAATDVMAHERAEVVIVKDGASGAHVVQRDGCLETVPAFASRGAHKIGSGDVFSAIFAHLWSEQDFSALDAAEAASRHAAHYVGTRLLPCPNELPDMMPRRMRSDLTVLVVADCVSSGDLWVFHEACSGLRQLGATVRTMLVDAISNRGQSSDLFALRRVLGRTDIVLVLASDARPPLLAVVEETLDCGTPILAFAERNGAVSNLAALNCPVVGELASAVYQTVWMGI